MEITIYVPRTVSIPDCELAKLHAGVLLERKLRRVPHGSRNVLTSELVKFADERGLVEELPAGWCVDAAQEFPFSAEQLDEAATAGRCDIPLAEYIDRLAAVELDPRDEV